MAFLGNKTFDQNTRLQMVQNILSWFTSFDKIPYSKLETNPKPTQPNPLFQDVLIKLFKSWPKISLPETKKFDKTDLSVAETKKDDDIEHETKKLC